jgi:hypothetical protein
VEIPNPESGCEFPEVLVEIQRWVWISRGHKAQKASAAFFFYILHKISIYTNEQKARKQQPKAASACSCISKRVFIRAVLYVYGYIQREPTPKKYQRTHTKPPFALLFTGNSGGISS